MMSTFSAALVKAWMVAPMEGMGPAEVGMGQLKRRVTQGQVREALEAIVAIALDLTAALSSEERYRRLLESLRRVTQAAALFIAEWCGVEARRPSQV